MSLKRNTAYNLVGGVVPALVALITVPLYIKLISPTRYGVLATVWAFLGYFGVFDLGLGRATSFRIAALRDSSAETRSATFYSAVLVNVCMGIAGGAVLWLTAAYYYEHVFKVSASLRPEIVAAVPFLALSVPIATLSGVLIGALQGRERFLATNVVSLTSALLFQTLPLAVVWFSGPNLSRILAAALTARCVALVMLAYGCHVEITRGHRTRIDHSELPTLLRYGGWVTLASLVGPLIAVFDRFAIGAVLGAFAVAVYATPMQFAKQIQLLPSALTNALFPRIAVASDAERSQYAQDAIYHIMITVSLPVLGLLFIVGPALWLWISKDIAVPAAPVARILLVGFWFNALALVPYTALQASGRPGLVTKILIAETIPYFVSIYFGMKYFGVTGAAGAFLLRSALDYALLSWLSDGRIFGFKVVAFNFVCLGAGIYAASNFTMHDWQWWAWSISLAAVMASGSWGLIPRGTRDQVRSLLQFPSLTRLMSGSKPTAG